jgi:hypothetical protein
MTTSNRQLTINGLLACGWREVKPAPSRKYVTFVRLDGQGRFFVGKSGALRYSKLGTVADSMSYTDGRQHRAYRSVGDPSIHWTSVDAARAAFTKITGGQDA